jgi:hypothetical protein
MRERPSVFVASWVHVFRFDWRNAKVPSWEAYANPLTIIRASPEQPGHLVPGSFPTQGLARSRYQTTAFLISTRILASVLSSSEVRVHATGCMLAPSSRAGFTTSPKPNAMKSLPGLM